MACYSTRICVLRATLELSDGIDNPEILHARIDALLKRVGAVQQEYGWDPPEAIKTELMNGIKTLLNKQEERY
jgi:hypothetical protein